ncbi:DNA polymerase III subunit gamma/tau [Colwellia sp. 1_MG-2023]|uniref:DNA polymerase III subunit gamma/tau n=1 Tax=Colwellia sp. 1_MG-2023 TaxID=3062649 RepID=UPI0026E23AE7|nr:DNA polymerase III subunit gamma/tau [Colwellia sp. 1_MG-2023]MDO6445731.1 DNA polymerase III subunit gamma/tau [Colwellia sp. 1_MG-2023]
MSYQVLARKWRPKSFHELMGQEHVVTVLTNALKQQRLHHAYLFTGTRGVGKTTIARIFAKSLNCDIGVTAEPCGKCDTCLDIDQGRFVDLLEIDAASRTKVDDTREILDNVQYAPTRGRYKVYLIDEVHMLSRSSFNALLKTLEEPPEHVKFILATTDPQKLPVTVLSRCLQFHLKALAVPQIERQLNIILTAEKVSAEPLAISLLAKAARGSMRDSLSLTDQAIAQGEGSIIASNVQKMLGGVDHHWVYKILIALIKQDAQTLMSLSLDIASYAPNYGRLMAELIQLLHQVAMAQVVDRHFDLSPEHNQLLEKFSQAMSPEDVQLYYQIVLAGRKDLPYAADEQAAFDMVLLRLLAFKPQKHAITVEEQVKTSVDFTASELNALNQPASEKLSINDNKAISHTFVQPVSQVIDDTDVDKLSAELESIEQQAAQCLKEGENTDTFTSLDESLAENPVQVDATKKGDFTNVNQAEIALTSASSISDVPNVDLEHSIEETLSNESRPDESLSNEQAPLLSEEEIAKVSPPQNASPIDSILASRNMLRSRKKALENDGKKHNDASERQKNTEKVINKPVINDVPDIATISEQPFTPEVIDPSVVKKANQVDRWANIIDSMALNGRLRQLALNATISDASDDEKFILELNTSTKHLKSPVALEQLEQFVSDYFDKPMKVEITVVEETIDDPFQIQGKINDKRYDYAKELLLKDEVVQSFKEHFQAEIDEESIIAR